MVLEEPPVPYWQWLVPSSLGIGALLGFVLLALTLTLLAVFACYVIATFLRGPGEGTFAVAYAVRDGIVDLLHVSPRRVLAVARLAVQEALRRRVLVGVALFILIILFGSWFLDVRSDHPARLYLSVVLTATQFIILLLVLFLSTFSLPNDIKNRTIYTVVTKPVRSIDIVLGRILGFILVGSALLVMMCLGSYVFLIRGLRHTHAVSAESLSEQRSAEGTPLLVGPSSFDSHHRHTVTIDEHGHGETDRVMDHSHQVQLSGEGQQTRYEVGKPTGTLQARVPIFGTLSFLNRFGQPGRGSNVGNEWAYRQYIEGRTRAAAIWRFDQIDQRDFPDGLPIEMTLSVFRTTKGNMQEPVAGRLEIRNPQPGAAIHRSAPIDFRSVEYGTLALFVDRQLDAVDPSGRPRPEKADLYRDFVHDGQLEIWVFCNEPQQFFGMAQADLYLRAADKSFFLNFIKCHLSIWFQMIIVICFGVTFSTLLNGPVAMLATLACIILGFNGPFIEDVARGIEMGGGPVESFYRIITQENVMVDLEPGIGTTTIKWIDFVMNFLTLRVSWLLPNFGDFNTSQWVADGFDIDPNLLAVQGTITFGFFVVLSIVGLFLLKTREIAA